MTIENLKQLDTWFGLVKGEKNLSVDEARRLNDRIRKLPPNRQELMEELVLGTMHVVYDFLKNFNFIDALNGTYDIDDLINSFCEVWIENLEQGLYKTNDFSKMFNSRFFDKLNEKLGINEKDSIFPHITKIDFNEMFFDFFERHNDGEIVSYDDFMKNIEKYNNKRKINSVTISKLKYEYSQFYKLLNKSYDIYVKYGNSNIPFSKGYVSFLMSFLIEMVLEDYEDSYNVGSIRSSYDSVVRIDKNDVISKVLGTLTDDERRVMLFKYGLDGCEELSYKNMAKVLGNRQTVEAIRGIEENAVKKIRYSSRERCLRDYYE